MLHLTQIMNNQSVFCRLHVMYLSVFSVNRVKSSSQNYGQKETESFLIQKYNVMSLKGMNHHLNIDLCITIPI